MAHELIERLGLAPLPAEGGWFRQTWRSPDEVGGRPVGTAIVALFDNSPLGFSALHRLATAEVWHFYRGDPFELLLLERGGSSSTVLLGAELEAGEVVQATVDAGVWMGGRPAGAGTWSLVGCTMAPGFVDGDFELGDRETLMRRYPSRAEDIAALTRGVD
ncbi:MAG TPA: cupin domain-containing protein [Acidimicrobiales bacterium]